MAQRPSVGEYITVLKTSVPKMINQIKELATAEIKPMAKNGGIGVGGLVVAAVIAIVMLNIILLAMGFGLSIIFAEPLNRHPVTALALGFTAEALILLILAVIFGLIGWRFLKKVKAPQATIAEAKASISALGAAVEKGVSDAETRKLPAGAENIQDMPGLAKPDKGWTHN